MSSRSLRLAGALLTATLTAACRSADPAPGEITGASQVVIVNARLVDGDGDALLFNRELGTIVGTGDAAALREEAGPDATIIDAQGGLVFAGLQDAHSHVLSGGLAGNEADLEGADTLEACLEAVRAWAEAHPDAPWVVGRGWSYNIVPKGQFPTREALDRAVPDRPALLEAYDGHSSWANSKALALAGVGPDTPDPDDGKIVREADGKTPQGTLLENASSLVQSHVPETDRATKLAAVERALNEYLRLGVTTVQTMCGSIEEVGLYEELLAAKRLPVRVVVALPLETPIDEVTAVRDRLAAGASDWLRLGFLKGFLDGIVESRTAFMVDPYVGTDERGAPAYSEVELVQLVHAADAAGVAVALHAIGDAAVRMALDAYAAARRNDPPGTPGVNRLRHRIEHIEVVHPDDLPRFKALDVIASMQPYHSVPSDEASEDDVWSANLGPERLRRAFAWRALLDAGAPLAFGSDWPVFTHDPLKGIAVASTRQNERGLPAGGWQAHQKITAEEAIRAYTSGAAYAVRAPARVGTLEPGAPADLVVLSPDVRLDDPKTFFSGRARCVILAGKVVVGP